MRIDDLPLDERVKLVEDIWDSIAAEQEALSITPEQRQELDRRLERYRIDGDRGAPAAECIERIRRLRLAAMDVADGHTLGRVGEVFGTSLSVESSIGIGAITSADGVQAWRLGSVSLSSGFVS